MHSNRINIVIGLIILAISVFLLTIYASKQGEMTFSFFFTVCREIKFTLQRWWGSRLCRLLNIQSLAEFKRKL